MALGIERPGQEVTNKYANNGEGHACHAHLVWRATPPPPPQCPTQPFLLLSIAPPILAGSKTSTSSFVLSLATPPRGPVVGGIPP